MDRFGWLLIPPYFGSPPSPLLLSRVSIHFRLWLGSFVFTLPIFHQINPPQRKIVHPPPVPPVNELKWLFVTIVIIRCVCVVNMPLSNVHRFIGFDRQPLFRFSRMFLSTPYYKTYPIIIALFPAKAVTHGTKLPLPLLFCCTLFCQKRQKRPL